MLQLTAVFSELIHILENVFESETMHKVCNFCITSGAKQIRKNNDCFQIVL